MSEQMGVQEIMEWFAQHHYPATMSYSMTDTVNKFIRRVEELEKVGKEMLEFLTYEGPGDVTVFQVCNWKSIIEKK